MPLINDLLQGPMMHSAGSAPLLTKRSLFDLTNPPCLKVYAFDNLAHTKKQVSWLNDIQDIAFNGTNMYVVISGAQVYSSPDLVTFTARTLTNLTTLNFNCLTYGNGLFVAYGFSATDVKDMIWTSPDGITWTKRTSPFNLAAADVTNSLSFAGGIFYLTNGLNVWYSATGYTGWTQIAALNGLGSNGHIDLINGVYFLYSTSTSQGYQNIYSTNGTTWQALGTTTTPAMMITYISGSYYFFTVTTGWLKLSALGGTYTQARTLETGAYRPVVTGGVTASSGAGIPSFGMMLFGKLLYARATENTARFYVSDIKSDTSMVDPSAFETLFTLMSSYIRLITETTVFYKQIAGNGLWLIDKNIKEYVSI